MGEIGQPFGPGRITLHGRTLYGADEIVGPWVQSRIPGHIYRSEPTIGVIIDGKIAAGVVYGNFNGVHCEASIAADPGSRWANKSVLFAIFHYPFEQLGCQAISVLVAMSNLPSLNLATKLGFEPEAIVRLAAHDGGDLIVLKAYRENCRWIGYHGKQQGRQSTEGRRSEADGSSGSAVQPA